MGYNLNIPLPRGTGDDGFMAGSCQTVWTMSEPLRRVP